MINLKNIKWKDVITVSISIISVLIALYNWNDLRNMKTNYGKSVNEILVNSNRLAIQDLDVLYATIESSKNKPVTRSNLNIILDSLEKNYEKLNEIKLTDISSKERLTYQSFSNDLFYDHNTLKTEIDNVIEMNNEIEKRMSDTEKTNLDKAKNYYDQLLISDESREGLLELIKEIRKDALWNIDQLKNKKFISLRSLEKADSEFAEKYNLTK
ncbi:hypothetical protein FAE02_001796 [Enterococcus faecium]|uniref:hypothetical protein n=2 Tax=Enterococcus TaxID=1350 RepID=UPI00081374B8|nr:hypothetical protein [Enterococcus lactis]AWX47325.1 hypothetical protein DPR13_05105 [Enterococcus faecium]EGP4970384.1 hypothetical protein [Enterococcus faecium]EGP5163522.1 hypothetical protein [Enterococcus faecium]EGP5317839.1 hypothetical protein [Enterococcus faecium]EGP5455509.1 hypothetical protein [Enterococcus faecium]